LGYFGEDYRCVILIAISVTQIGFLKFENPTQEIIENTPLLSTILHKPVNYHILLLLEHLEPTNALVNIYLLNNGFQITCAFKAFDQEIFLVRKITIRKRKENKTG